VRIKATHLVEWDVNGVSGDLEHRQSGDASLFLKKAASGDLEHRQSGDASLFLKKAASTVHQLFGESTVLKTYVHVGSSKRDIARKLAVFSLSIEGLPKSLGGEWGYAKLTQWQELRTRLEWGLPAGSAGKEDNMAWTLLRSSLCTSSMQKISLNENVA